MLIDKDKSSLLIIDVQEKLVSAMPKPHKFIDNIIKLQKAANILKVKTVVSEQYPKGLGKTIDKINENFSKFTKRFEKTKFSADSLGKSGRVSEKETLKMSEKIEEGLKFGKAIDQFIICGIEAHVCVLQTAIRLAGFLGDIQNHNAVYVVQDAVSSRYEKDYLTALSRLDKYPNIHLVSCEMVLFEWLRSSDHPEFKTISQLIK